jgi:hypothetical protein
MSLGATFYSIKLCVAYIIHQSMGKCKKTVIPAPPAFKGATFENSTTRKEWRASQIFR